MPSVNQKLLDYQIAHAVHVLKFGNGLSRKIAKLLEDADKSLVERLAARLATIDERGLDIGPSTTARIKVLIDELRTLNSSVYSRAKTELVTELRSLAKAESNLQAQALDNSIPIDYDVKVPSANLLKALVTEQPMHGKLLEPFVDEMAASTISAVEQVVRQGMATGLTIDQMVRALKGTQSNGYNGILKKRRSSVQAMVRTATNHVANQAAQATWRENSDIIKGYQWVSVLDSHTSTICGSRDGKVFEVGKGPVPPAHPNCRSTTTAVTKSFKELGIDRDEVDEQTRASMDGQVPARTTFADWLKQQSEERQNAVLGKTKAAVFRSGKLDLQQFVREDGHELTLDELKRLHPTAF